MSPLFSTSEWGADPYTDDDGDTSDPPLPGIPYSLPLYGDDPPLVMISQGDRYYPMAQADEFVAVVNTNIREPQPQYVWDCVFRRFQGRILVAIFVYRVTAPGGGNVTYRIPPTLIGANLPSLPINLQLDLTNPADAWDSFGPDEADQTGDEAFVYGSTRPASAGDIVFNTDTLEVERDGISYNFKWFEISDRAC